MGIQNFHTWLKQRYLSAYIPIKSNNIYEYIYLDVNYILHNSIYNCKTESDFIKKLYVYLDIIFTNFIATKKIFFSLDGPSSYAKILLQRKRRAEGATKITENVISSLYITPGTETMGRIEGYLRTYIHQLKTRYRYINPEIYMSSSNEPDEGEVKICKEVIINGSQNLTDKHLIVGNDSDLIVLSMGMKPIYNINILVKGKSENELISLSELLQLHCKHINRANTLDKLAYSRLRDDFVIVSIMMGNDYLPKLGYIKYDKIWEVYYDFMLSLHNAETLMDNDCTFNTNIFQRFLYDIYSSLSGSCKKVTVNTYDEDRSKMYLEGLLWCLKMYQQGKCPKYDYAYSEHNTVHPYELLFHMFADKTKLNMNSQISHPISAELYSLIVMPKKASFLIPKKYHNLMNDELKYLYEVEECAICSKHKNVTKNINLQIKELGGRNVEIDDVNVLKNKYKENMRIYLKHKKKHDKQFSVNDIDKIIELAKKVDI